MRAFIADGSHWLWNLADRHFGSAVKIVDFWHVCEHVGKKEFGYTPSKQFHSSPRLRENLLQAGKLHLLVHPLVDQYGNIQSGQGSPHLVVGLAGKDKDALWERVERRAMQH
ncbi:MAG: hypothetical protein ACLFVU_12105 [Phycisphaerae bacterium]